MRIIFMKLAEIVIGHEYITTVSGVSRRVRVLRSVVAYSGRTKFVVQNVKSGAILPKYRSPAALYAVPVRVSTVPNECGVCNDCTAGTGCELICKSA